MKIAFLNIYNGVVERGSEIFVDELAKQLSSKHQVVVYQSGKADNQKYDVKEIKGIPYLKNQGTAYRFWLTIFTLKSLPFLLSGKYDWIIPINGSTQVIICHFVRLIKKCKILISGHAGIGFEDKFNILFGKPDIFVALSPDEEEWAKKFTTNLKYIPNGVNVYTFNPKVKPALLPLKPPIIMCNSAFLPYKRIDLVIKAVAKVENASLLIIGDGPTREGIKNLAESALSGRFKIIRSVKHSQIASYYNASNLFSMVSEKSEAFGLVYLEAMACNIPVVAPDDTNRREIIGESGLFCDPKNTIKYAETIKKALSINWANKPRIQAEKYSWEKIAVEYEKIMAIK